MSHGLVVLMLALLLGIQPITTDLYLPALPMLTAGFGASVAQAQLTLTALLLAFGLSQLVWGPLSDRFGRRPILLVGISLNVLASVACALSPSMFWLIVFRALQGAAMGAAVMCARAIVRDLFSPADGARAISQALSGLGVMATLCVPLGALLAQRFGWRSALLGMTVFSVAVLLLVALRFKESLLKPNLDALNFKVLWKTWFLILCNPTFRAFASLSSATYGGLFTYLAASSFVFISALGLKPLEYSLVMTSTALAYIPGTFFARASLKVRGVRRTVAISAAISLAGGALLVLLALLEVRNPWVLILPLCVYMFGHGTHQACGTSGSVGPFPQAAGAAAALNGFLMMVLAFAIGAWLGKALGGTVSPHDAVMTLALGVGFFSVCVAFVAWVLVQRHGATVAH